MHETVTGSEDVFTTSFVLINMHCETKRFQANPNCCYVVVVVGGKYAGDDGVYA